MNNLILICNDFEFLNAKLSDKGLMSVNFDTDTTLPSAIIRELEVSEMNKYKHETFGYGMKYTDVLEFEIHIMKNCKNTKTQSEFKFSNDEYEDIVAWLTSIEEYSLLKISKGTKNNIICKGYFSTVEPFDAGGVCYGFKCVFKCNSPFSYVEKAQSQTIVDKSTIVLKNDSSERNSYVYPSLLIKPSQNEEIFIHNLSDSMLIESGVLESITCDNLIEKINTYGRLQGYTVTYMYDKDNISITAHCNATVVLFYFTDSYGVKNKYVAYYFNDGKYYIYRGGFFYCTLYKDLDVTIDCKNLVLYDSLHRPVLFSKMGIQDEDEIYWLRLLYGKNNLIIKGNVEIDFNWMEPRKGELV